MTFYYEKKFNIFLIMLITINHLCSGQTTEYPPDSKPASTNVPGAEFAPLLFKD